MKMLAKVPVPVDTPYLFNKYTQWYYSLISACQGRNLNTEPSGHTEKHHIIPKCMFKINNRKQRVQGFLDGDPDKQDNIVVLTYREHIVAHWLLTKMLTGTFHYKMESALSRFKYKSNKLQITSLEISRIKIAHKSKQKGLSWWNDGTHQILCDQRPNDNYSKGMLTKSSKGYKVWHNGSVNTTAKLCPGPEWKLGKAPGTNSSAGNKWWNNGDINVQARVSPGDGWALGRFKTMAQQASTSQKLKGVKWWFNGAKWTRAHDCPGPDWVHAKRSSPKKASKGTSFWHKGELQQMSKVCPGPDWHPGRIPNTSASTGKPNVNKGRKLWNNGVDQKTSHTCPGPDWVQGRLR